MYTPYPLLPDHEGSAMERPEMSERGLTLRARIAQALADLAVTDPSMAAAFAVHEEWRSGYIGRLLVSAELLATQWTNDFGVPEAALSVDDAVRRAVDNANPRGTLQGLHHQVGNEAKAAMTALLQAQATFHRHAGGLDRRQLRRPENEDHDLTDLVNG